MPSYFYHISLEILSYERSGSGGVDQGKTTSPQTSLPFESACEALLPFQKRHRHKSSGRGLRTAGHERDQCLAPQLLNASQYQSSSDHTETFAGKTPHHLPSVPRSANTRTAIDQDLRLDRLHIESIDMVPPEQNTSQSKWSDRSLAGSNPVTTGIGTDILGGLHTKGRYVPLDQKLSDSVWGIVHLYRDAKETPSLGIDDYPAELKGSSAARQPRDRLGGGGNYQIEGEAGRSSSRTPPDEECTTLCILAVPSYMSPSDFLGFVGEQTRDDVSHFRMIRTARANRYMVLMKFRNGRKAKEWQREWNGKVFNSMEPETCHVVFVKTVEIQAVTPDKTDAGDRSLTQSTAANITGQSSSLSTASLSSKPLAPPTPSLIELPTCPVCLERMDETTGLLTIICQHVFHCTCLQKWKGSGCPVCRYTQDGLARRAQNLDLGEGPCECSVCHSELNLWLCLICGNIGCGRYDGAHAFDHFKQTSHAFAMDLATQRVWDYVGDGYVHRIIQSKTDGKLVELPARDDSALDPPDWEDAVPREKLENMSVEYTHLLTSQLESQRAYFEEILERAADKASQASSAASAAQEAAEKATANLKSLQQQYDRLTNETIPGLERDKTRAEKRAEKFEGMARKMEKEWREEKTMNESLMQRVEFLSAEVEKLKVENTDLSEQNRDLTFFISGSEKLKDQGDDVVEGTISIPEAESSKKKKNRGKGKR
ncbi:RING and UBP finger domain protein, putative [Paecilomyces variotii No. 5]|uniref:RING and UBP finger domain protein, putative n=1 Tax=Byssochlamys spectabilis (strain No. 5 / NBRC 109023) TaxID=1356009 RepID=V5I564_BYSSN|nr:RING and UBP finger domain protein, putative [Paecilomyces variotii No. 5]